MDDERLWGWDATPGIVSVWAESDGRAVVWRRLPGTLELVREDERFRPWMLLASLDDLRHLGPDRMRREGEAASPGVVTYRELEGEGALRFLVTASDGRALSAAVMSGARHRLGHPISNLRELGAGAYLALPPEEQYLVATGRTYFRDLGFDDLRRMQFDLETTGLDPESARVFLIAVRFPDGTRTTLAAAGDRDGNADDAEADLILRFLDLVRVADPDVLENHNLHGFDLPFLAQRAKALAITVSLGREGLGFRQRPSARGMALTRGEPRSRVRFTVPGRELIDTMDAVLRHDFSARDLPGHGLKAVAKHFGLARENREHIPGARIFEVFARDPDRVRRYAEDDVDEAAGLARLLGGAAFALAKMAPRRYERLADAGAATGVLDPLLVRAYLRAGAALPAHEPGDGTAHSGAALYLFATGVAHNIVKADVASLYPSLMRQYRIGPRRDRLGVLLALVDALVERRLDAKAKAKKAAPGSPERFTNEALSAAMKLVVNSAYGYLGAVGLTRFADVHAANDVTRRGRDVLALLCRELAARNVTLLEADTDGVYFAVDASFDEAKERALVAEVGALLPSLVHLEHDGRFAAMLSHEPKNYALLPFAGPVVLRGVAFRSSRAEPFGDAFLRRALTALLERNVQGVRDAYVDSVLALRARKVRTFDVAARVRLTKSPAQYLSTRAKRRELAYEALLASGRTTWSSGERAWVYKQRGGGAGLVEPPDDAEPSCADRHDYDVEHYVRVLRDNFASRIVRAVTREDYAAIVADPGQPSLFARKLSDALPILVRLDDPVLAFDDAAPGARANDD